MFIQYIYVTQQDAPYKVKDWKLQEGEMLQTLGSNAIVWVETSNSYSHSTKVSQMNEIFLLPGMLHVTKRRVWYMAKKGTVRILEEAKSGSLISNSELKFPTRT
jgi:hypothetical protein